MKIQHLMSTMWNYRNPTSVATSCYDFEHRVDEVGEVDNRWRKRGALEGFEMAFIIG